VDAHVRFIGVLKQLTGRTEPEGSQLRPIDRSRQYQPIISFFPRQGSPEPVPRVVKYLDGRISAHRVVRSNRIAPPIRFNQVEKAALTADIRPVIMWIAKPGAQVTQANVSHHVVQRTLAVVSEYQGDVGAIGLGGYSHRIPNLVSDLVSGGSVQIFIVGSSVGQHASI